jgi:polysaccharide export outer membrane protein
MPDINVNVSIKNLAGTKVYVLGNVNKPGEYTVTRLVDVMQALSIAAGVNRFAAEDEIKILRRTDANKQSIFPFNYNKVALGKKLYQNILLKSGDIIIVP